mgnify:CR=1 FL=1
MNTVAQDSVQTGPVGDAVGNRVVERCGTGLPSSAPPKRVGGRERWGVDTDEASFLVGRW